MKERCMKTLKTLLGISLFMFAASGAFAEAESKKKEVPKETKQALRDVLEKNEKLHDAFFKYEGKKVEAAAGKVKEAMAKIQDEEIAKKLSFSMKKLDAIKAKNNRKENNQNYHLVSMALIHLVNTYDLGEEYQAYSCPMVQKKWVQNTEKKEKVHNPYAPGMPHCGGRD